MSTGRGDIGGGHRGDSQLQWESISFFPSVDYVQVNSLHSVRAIQIFPVMGCDPLASCKINVPNPNLSVLKYSFNLQFLNMHKNRKYEPPVPSLSFNLHQHFLHMCIYLPLNTF